MTSKYSSVNSGKSLALFRCFIKNYVFLTWAILTRLPFCVPFHINVKTGFFSHHFYIHQYMHSFTNGRTNETSRVKVPWKLLKNLLAQSNALNVPTEQCPECTHRAMPWMFPGKKDLISANHLSGFLNRHIPSLNRPHRINGLQFAVTIKKYGDPDTSLSLSYAFKVTC